MFKKSRTRIIMCSILLFSILMLPIYSHNTAIATSDTDNTKELAVSNYLSDIKNSNFDNIVKKVKNGNIGKNVYDDESAIAQSEAEKKGLLISEGKKDNSDNMKKMLKDQKDFINKNFGSNAWDNLTYTISEVNSGDGRPAYIMSDSQKEITEEEYCKENTNYWEKIAAQEGVKFEDIFNTAPEGVITDPAIIKAIEVYQKYSDNEPAIITLLPSYNRCEVKLKFNGKSKGADGTSDYRFYISNETGVWNLESGITWEPAESKPTIENFD